MYVSKAMRCYTQAQTVITLLKAHCGLQNKLKISIGEQVDALFQSLFSAFWLRSSVVSVLIVLIGRYGFIEAFPD
jgi:hypothetical protein